MHSVPPRVVSTAQVRVSIGGIPLLSRVISFLIQIRSWIRHSDLENLEQCVLDGHGHSLITENASDNKIRAFIKSVPSYMVRKGFFPAV